MSKFDVFLQRLSKVALPKNCFNPYAIQHKSGSSFNKSRRQNLRLYLQQMAHLQPTVLMVGEAPGYRGCRLTGIPFVSPAILAAGVESHQLFGKKNGYDVVPEWEFIQREASSTIMWGALEHATTPPILWNAFPFHPHKPQNNQSNRPPTRGEVALGRPFLTMLREMFELTAVIAIGNKADDALSRWQVPHHKIRHPSHGGKSQFLAGLHNLVTFY